MSLAGTDADNPELVAGRRPFRGATKDHRSGATRFCSLFGTKETSQRRGILLFKGLPVLLMSSGVRPFQRRETLTRWPRTERFSSSLGAPAHTRHSHLSCVRSRLSYCRRLLLVDGTDPSEQFRFKVVNPDLPYGGCPGDCFPVRRFVVIDNRKRYIECDVHRGTFWLRHRGRAFGQVPIRRAPPIRAQTAQNRSSTSVRCSCSCESRILIARPPSIATCWGFVSSTATTRCGGSSSTRESKTAFARTRRPRIEAFDPRLNSCSMRKYNSLAR